MKLESLKPAQGSVRTNTRLGRGQGSGGGGTAKRGHKGAKSRSGYSRKLGFEGGQMPLQRRVPKFGFNNMNRVEYKAINLDSIQALFDKTKETNITLAFLKEHGLASKTDLIKVLGRGEFTAKVNVSVHAFSKSAAEAIAKAGGSTNVLSSHAPAAEVAPVMAAAPAKKAAKAEGDDLTKIEGIGPKISEVLIANGVTTFAQLATTATDTISAWLEAADGNFAAHTPATWGQQAQLAADGKWDELKELQDQLNGGRPE
jgi:large subunit ribosomal protein L15